MRERRALVVFLLLAGVFVAGLLLAERRKSAVSADRVEAEMEATVAADSVRPVSYTHLDVYKRQVLLPLKVISTAGI